MLSNPKAFLRLKKRRLCGGLAGVEAGEFRKGGGEIAQDRGKSGGGVGV